MTYLTLQGRPYPSSTAFVCLSSPQPFCFLMYVPLPRLPPPPLTLPYRAVLSMPQMLLMIALTILCGSCFFVMIYPPMRWLERRFFSTVFAHGNLVS